MTIASIELSEQEARALRELAQQTGKTQDGLLHEAITHLLTRGHPHYRLAALQQAKGLWKERTDLPDIRILRAELERFTS